MWELWQMKVHVSRHLKERLFCKLTLNYIISLNDLVWPLWTPTIKWLHLEIILLKSVWLKLFHWEKMWIVHVTTMAATIYQREFNRAYLAKLSYTCNTKFGKCSLALARALLNASHLLWLSTWRNHVTIFETVRIHFIASQIL